MRNEALALLLTCVASGHSANLPDFAQLEPDIQYDEHAQTVLDVISPKNVPSGAKLPGVIAIHGGGWVNGSKEAFLERVLPWVEKGFVAANVEYRLAGVAPAPAAVNDVLKAAQFFRKNAKRWNVDVKRIVVMGGSAGGHLALLTGLVTKGARLGPTADVAAVVNFYGITDVEDMMVGPNAREFASKWIAGSPEPDDAARRLSPVSYIRKDVPPVLSVHGNADQTVPYDHSVTLTRLLRDAGADAEMISVPGGKHPLTPEELQAVYPQIWEFLERRGILK
jgi:acetyl esterase/lipase